MNPKSPVKPVTNPKLDQFLEQLNNLLKHYQYALVPYLKVTESGITASLKVSDRVPSPATMTPLAPATLIEPAKLKPALDNKRRTG